MGFQPEDGSRFHLCLASEHRFDNLERKGRDFPLRQISSIWVIQLQASRWGKESVSKHDFSDWSKYERFQKEISNDAMTIELMDFGCTCCRHFSQFLFVSICNHFQMKRGFWQTFHLQCFRKHGQNKQSIEKPSDYPLDNWFCGRYTIEKIFIRYLWQKQWFWTTCIFLSHFLLE